MNPQDFILRTRIQASAADLRKTTESLADLATKYGFCDQSAYSRQFWKLIGTTPGEYRKINAQSQQ
jgi:AraC-like DNA-binding protein